jgi:hypothetical protein
MHRRDVIVSTALIGAWLVWALRLARGQIPATSPRPSLRSAPIELMGTWGESAPGDVLAVLSRMRQACLGGIRLVSDRQPDEIRVDNHTSGTPAVWLHPDHTDMAWLIVDVGPFDWSKLSYQFGHELGHVLCNSWGPDAVPRTPCQWLEESMVEAFSIRGLGVLATSWEESPPFPNDQKFGDAIRRYRQNLIDGYRDKTATEANLAEWFRANRSTLEHAAAWDGPAVVGILHEFEGDKGCVEDLGAVNRWPGRSGVPLADYLRLWLASCAEVRAPGHLPARLKELLGLG